MEKSFYDHGFAITKEEVSEIFSLLEEKSNGGKIDFKNFDKILLEMTQELNKHIQENKF